MTPIKEGVEYYNRYIHWNLALAMAESEELMVQISRAATLDQAQELARAWLLVWNSEKIVQEPKQEMQIGDLCRTTEGAPARYIGNGRAMYISAQSNDIGISKAAPAIGGEDKLPLPDDDDLRSNCTPDWDN